MDETVESRPALRFESAAQLQSAAQVIQSDVEYILENAQACFSLLAGRDVLLVGGAGFLGYYFVKSIVAWNNSQASDSQIRLHVFDNYIRGVPSWIEELEATRSDLVIRKHDITHELPSGCPDYDYIIHAASIASPIFYRKHPIETMDANVNGLRILLNHFARTPKNHQSSGFLYFSTSEIYGDPTPENIPTPESYRGNVSCTGPRACYDESKRYGETLCVNFAQQLNLPIRIARPFNNYGPGLKITDRRVIPDFAGNVLSGKDICLLSDGSPTRTFCYITDAIVGYLKVLTQGKRGEAYNIGIEKPEISMATLAEMIVANAASIWGYQGRVVRAKSSDRDYLVDNPNRRCPVIQKARDELNYSPTIGIEEGIRRTLIWYQDNKVAKAA